MRIFVVGCAAVLLVACGDASEPAMDTTNDGAIGEGQPMEISFERWGGFAGITRSIVVSTDDLTPDEAAALRGLVADAEFFDLPEVIEGDGAVADDFMFVIAVTGEAGIKTVTTSDAAAPDSMRPLLDWLNRAARSGGG